MEHVDKRSGQDEWGNLILRFYNGCGVGMYVSACIQNSGGTYNVFTVFIPDEENGDMNVGRDVPDQTFNYTWHEVTPPPPYPCGK